MVNETHSEEAVKIKVNQIKSEIEEENQEEEIALEEKPLEMMSKKELRQKIEEYKEESETNHDLYLRAKAETDNIIKRNKREKEEWIKYSNETLIKELLPVIDNLEKAIAHSNEDNSLHALREGVELTLKGFMDTLTKAGVEPVKTEGEPFDPCFHHAVSEQNDDKVEAGTVLNELQKGYTLNQRLIRPAMVVLSKGKEGSENNRGNNPEGACEE